MFPARAGMNRLFPFRFGAEFDVPRTCGDEPISGIPTGLCDLCSPHVRG